MQRPANGTIAANRAMEAVLGGAPRGMRSASLIVAAAIAVTCAHGPPPALHATRLVVVQTASGIRPFVRAKVAGEMVPLLLTAKAPLLMLKALPCKAPVAVSVVP